MVIVSCRNLPARQEIRAAGNAHDSFLGDRLAAHGALALGLRYEDLTALAALIDVAIVLDEDFACGRVNERCRVLFPVVGLAAFEAFAFDVHFSVFRPKSGTAFQIYPA